MSISRSFRRETLAAACLAVATLALTGCASFWTPITSTTTGGGGTGTDLVYAGKNGSSSFVGYSISTTSGVGGLTPVIGSPYSIGSPPLSMAITPSDNYLYIGTALGIYGYSIATGGQLTALNSGAVVANSPIGLLNGPVSMDISPDGNWLAVLTPNISGTTTIYIYQIASSTGLLTSNYSSSFVPSASTAISHTIKFSPNEGLLGVTMGTGGTLVFTFSSTAGTFSTSYTALTPPSNLYSDNDVKFSAASTTIFISRGGAASDVFYYAINPTTGAVTTCSCYITTGTNPTAISFNTATAATQNYLYVVNSGNGTSVPGSITGFPVSTNTTTNILTPGTSALYNSPYSTIGYTPYAIAFDNDNLYMLVMNQTGPPDLVEYFVDPTAATIGQLYVAASVNTGLTTTVNTLPISGMTMVTTH